MMSYNAIVDLREEMAAKARRGKLTPRVFFDAQDIANLFAGRNGRQDSPIPSFGDYRPKGWTLAEDFFVDSSGMGSDSEPALSQRQFRELIEQHHRMGDGSGWAVIEAGQFQATIGRFKKVVAP